MGCTSEDAKELARLGGLIQYTDEFQTRLEQIRSPLTPAGESYLSTTQLEDGSPSIMVDCGSVGNLTGDEPAKTTAKAASRGGRKVRMTTRDKPLNVS
jgi:hypothetical protein